MLEMLIQWYRRLATRRYPCWLPLVASLALSFSLVACLLRCWWLLCCYLLGAQPLRPNHYWLFPPLGDVGNGGFVGILLLMAFALVSAIASSRAST